MIKIGKNYLLNDKIEKTLELNPNTFYISNILDTNNMFNDNIIYLPCILEDEYFQNHLSDYHRRSHFKSVSEKFKANLVSLSEMKMSINNVDKFVDPKLLMDFYNETFEAYKFILESNEIPKDYEYLKYAFIIAEYISTQSLLYNKKKVVINYNPFTQFGRFGLRNESFNILSLEKSKRYLLTPPSDEFEICEFDFNAFEIRVLLAVCGVKQPEGDLYDVLHHQSNFQYQKNQSRADFKKDLIVSIYSQKEYKTVLRPILEYGNMYKKYPIINDHVINVFGKKMKTDRYHLLSRILQSTAAYIFYKQIYTLMKYIHDNNLTSKLSFCIHDAISILLHKDEKSLKDTFKNILENIEIDEYKSTFPTKVKTGKNYGYMS